MSYSMQFGVNTVTGAPYVVIAYERELPWPEITSLRPEVGRGLSESRLKGILFDVSVLRTAPEAGELYELSQRLAQMAPESTRIALVVRPDQLLHAKRLGELARASGRTLAVFITRDNAEVWLQNQPPPPSTHQ